MLKLKLITGLGLLLGTIFGINTDNSNYDPYLEGIDSTTVVNSAPSIQMYFYIKKYAEQYDIPEAYAFSLAYQETTYQGPMDLDYHHAQTSYAGAVGPMQIMPKTANWLLKKPVSKSKLKNDIELNVMISMMFLRKLHNQYKDWGLVFGYYNTGKPCINQYAKNILKKQYNWVI